MNMPNDVNDLEALNTLGWETLEVERVKSKAKQMYKVLHDMTPNCLLGIFTYKSEILDHNLRGSLTSLQLPFLKTESLKKSVSYSGAKVWNSLPSRECQSLPIFKSKIDAHTYSI